MSAEKPRVPFELYDLIITLFKGANIVVPLTAIAVLVWHIYFKGPLSWEFLAVVATGLLPFLLPLLGVYVGKIAGLEMNNVSGKVPPGIPPNSAPPSAIPAVPNPPTSASPTMPQGGQALESNRIPIEPNFQALTKEEQKLLRTLWKYQSQYLRDGQPGLWAFKVSQNSPDYRGFQRGFSDLAQRGLVLQDDRGLAFLSNAGLEYCKRNSDFLNPEGDVWKDFVPV